MSRILVGTFLLASLLSPFGGSAHRKTEEGNRYYDVGEFDEALAAYTEAQVHAPESPGLHYDVGNVLYRQDDYEGAAEAFTRALLSATPDLAPHAAYNLGNSRFQQQDYKAAVEAYRRALEAHPGDIDAKRNLELALRALEQQEQQEQEGEPGENDQSEDQQQDQQQQPDEGEQPDQQEDSSPQPQQQPSDQEEMTPEQARRLLDGLAEEEQKGLREEAQRRAVARGTKREKDW